MKDPPIFTGKIGMTQHARDRMKERNVSAAYVKRKLALIPYREGRNRWVFKETNFFVGYVDHSGNQRTILTLGIHDPNWKSDNTLD